MDSTWKERIETLWQSYQKGETKVLLEAEKLLDEEIPDDFASLVYASLATFAIFANDLQKAEGYVQKAQQAYTPSSINVKEEALCVLQQLPNFYRGLLKETRDSLTQSSYADNYRVKFLLAECNYWLGEFTQSQDLYHQADAGLTEELFSEKQLCSVGEARVQLRLGNMAEAQEILENIYTKSGTALTDATDKYKVYAASDLAISMAMQGKIPEARLMFHPDLNPNNFSHPYRRSLAHFTRGLVRMHAGSLEGAKHDLIEATNAPIRELTKVEFYFYLGEVCLELGEKQEAIDWYSKVAKFSQIFLTSQVVSIFESLQVPLKVPQDDTTSVAEKPVAEKVPAEEKVVEEKVEKTPVEEETFVVEEKVEKVFVEEKVAEKAPVVEKAEKTPVEITQTMSDSILSEIPISAILQGFDAIERQQLLASKNVK